MLTSRPEAARDALGDAPGKGKSIREVFKAWQPVEIEPKSEDNTADMQLVLRHRLAQGKPPLAAQADMDAAVELMTSKSQVI